MEIVVRLPKRHVKKILPKGEEKPWETALELFRRTVIAFVPSLRGYTLTAETTWGGFAIYAYLPSPTGPARTQVGNVLYTNKFVHIRVTRLNP